MPSAIAPVHRLTFGDVLRMYDAGILDEHDRLELVDGVLVEMSPIGPQHSRAVAWLTRHLSRPDRPWHVRIQDTMLIEGGYLMPGVTIIAEPSPRAEMVATALLAIEVAQTSQRRDAEKAADYACAGVPEYWIVDLAARVVIVHSGLRDGMYGDVRRAGDGTRVEGPVDVPAIDVSALLG